MSAYRDLVRAAESLIHTTQDGKVRADALARLSKAVDVAKRDRVEEQDRRRNEAREERVLIRQHPDFVRTRENLYRLEIDIDRRKRAVRKCADLAAEALAHLHGVRLPMWNAEALRRARQSLIALGAIDGRDVAVEAVAMRGRGEEAA